MEAEVAKNVVRGQYIRSSHGKEPVIGYREEHGVDPQSKTETYLAMKFFIDNFRWAGVPFYIRTGKKITGPGYRGCYSFQKYTAPPVWKYG